MSVSNHHVDFLDDNCWCNLDDYSILLQDAVPPTDLYWNLQPPPNDASGAIVASLTATTTQVTECAEERESQRKRVRSDQYGGTGTKACRERMRREKLNDRFSELSAVLEPGRPIKTDKLAILGDAIRVLNHLKTESEEYKEMNEKLSEEIKTLKSEKNELREEKLALKADKERMEQQMKVMAVPPTGFMPPHPPIHHHQPPSNKMPMYPSYSLVPMWQYMPPSARDTSQDHQLRPPAA